MRSLPFLPRFEESVRAGRKTVTSRVRCYGEEGDLLQTPFGVVRLTHVVRGPLKYVREGLWQEEGCSSPEEFEEVWRTIHPRMGFNPDRRVWVHFFRLLPLQPQTHDQRSTTED